MSLNFTLYEPSVLKLFVLYLENAQYPLKAEFPLKVSLKILNKEDCIFSLNHIY